MKTFALFTLLLFTCLCSLVAKAEVCQSWSAPERIGTLDTSLVMEASGLAVSRTHSDRLYWNNDSGDGAYFYVTNARGENARRITISGFTPHDAEDMAYGNCGGGKRCLAIGDIGDNSRVRPEIQVALIEEEAKLPETVRPRYVLRLRYPDGPHNAEALLLHPNGDLYIVTKESNAGRASAARVYRFSASEFAAAGAVAGMLEYVGEIDLPRIADATTYQGEIVTGASISADGSRVLLLTYQNALELGLDFANSIPATEELREGKDYASVALSPLLQQETIAFLPGDRAFIYSTEFADKGDAALMRVRCQY